MPAQPHTYEPAEGRDIAALLDPCPACIIGARSPEGRVGFATIIWAMPVSHNPAMTAFALRAKSHTMGLIKETGRFSLSTLPADAASIEVVEACGYQSGNKVDKGELVAHELREIEGHVLPVPAAALSWQLCEVESIQETGDHLLVVGRVVEAGTRASRDSQGRVAPVETLLCIQHGAYGGVNPL